MLVRAHWMVCFRWTLMGVQGVLDTTEIWYVKTVSISVPAMGVRNILPFSCQSFRQSLTYMFLTCIFFYLLYPVF